MVTSSSSSSKQEKTTDDHEDENVMAMAVNTRIRPHLPDLVIHQILELLPTKSAIRMSFLSKQWEGVCSLGPVIDFDEGGDNNLHHQHKKFVQNILKRYLELYCEKEEQHKQNLEKFKLHMTRYLSRDATIVTKWLTFSCKRSLKELDISLKRVRELQSHHRWSDMDMFSLMDFVHARALSRTKNYYYLSPTSLVNAKSVTSINLEYVRIKKIHPISVGRLLPSLKSMSLKTVHVDHEALLSLVSECPCIEHLSLTSCFFQEDIRVCSSSLKSLEIDSCEAFLIRVEDAMNLESLTVVSGIGSSEFPLLHQMIFRECFNLKYINICSSHLRSLYLDGCHDVKGTIDAPKLDFFTFLGYLESKFSLKAPNLRMTRIVLFDTWDREAAASFNTRPWKHFTTLSDFLSEFGCSKTLDLSVSDFKALIFPKDFRKKLSSPILPNLKQLYFSANSPPRKMRDSKDLTDSFYWMAPYLQYIRNLPWTIRDRPY